MSPRLHNLIRIAQELRDAARPRPLPLERPKIIQFPVNDICNSRCQMCNIWQQKLDRQITVEELDQILASPLFAAVEAVGLNGGEPTLRPDLPQLVEVLFRRLPRLRGVGLITNAYKSQQVIERITAVGEVVAAHGSSLDVMVSLDGVGDVHDRVRGRPGNFAQAERVIDAILASPLVHTRRFGCTVIRENVYHLHDLHEYALRKGIYIKYRLGIPHQRLYSRHVTDPFALTFEERCHLAIFLENLLQHYDTGLQQAVFYRSLIGQLMHDAPRRAGCDWQHKGVTISARGELLYCAVESRTLGDATKSDPEALYFGNEDHLKEIVANRCAHCTHDYMGLPPAGALAKSYARRAANRLGLGQARNVPLIQPLRRIKQTMQLSRGLQARLRAYPSTEQQGAVQPAAPRLRPTDRPPRVLLCGWYGTETTGDKAILGGVIAALRATLGPAELTLASLEPYISELTRNQMEELADVPVVDLQSAYELVPTMDLVVLAGGPLMAIEPLADIYALFHRAATQKIVTVALGCGVGPLGAPAFNQQIRAILDLASVRIYRDQRSAQLANDLGVAPGADAVAEDPALTWLDGQPASAPVRRHRQILLGLRDWPYHEYARHLSLAEGATIKERFEEELRAALSELAERYPDLTLLPVPMCTNHHGGDDRWFYRRWLRASPQLWERVDATLLGPDVSPTRVAESFRTAAVALTMRFHATLFALSAQTPVVAIDYTLGQGKVAALGGRYGLPTIALNQVQRAAMVAVLEPLLTDAPPRPALPAPTLTSRLQALLEVAR